MIDATETLAEIVDPLKERCEDALESVLASLDVVHDACELTATVQQWCHDLAGGLSGSDPCDPMWARLRHETGVDRLRQALATIGDWIDEAVGSVQPPSTTPAEVRAALQVS